jgi:hypothetical protein
LRHQLAVLRCQVARARFEPDDRVLLTAFARVLGRDRWSIFLVRPDTILRCRKTCPGMLSRRFARRDRIRAGLTRRDRIRRDAASLPALPRRPDGELRRRPPR